MQGRAQNLAACRLDEAGRVGLPLLAKGVIDGDEEPGVHAVGQLRLNGALGQRVGVIGPVGAHGRAFRVGGFRRCGPGQQIGLFRRRHHVLHRQRDGRGRAADDRIDTILLDPFLGDGHADIGLVLIVRDDNLDRGVTDLAAEILDRQLDRSHRAGAAVVGIGAGLVIHHADADHLVRHVGSGRHGSHRRGGAKCGKADAPAQNLFGHLSSSHVDPATLRSGHKRPGSSPGTISVTKRRRSSPRRQTACHR